MTVIAQSGVGYPPSVLIPGGPGGHERPARLLLVDDDSNLLVVLAEQLRADGYDVATARDGVEALRRLESAWPDLVLLDMMMPRLDGISLAREIKARADLPIIVLTAIDAADSKAELLDEVAEDYVTKPYHYPELRARINRACCGASATEFPGSGSCWGPSSTLELRRRAADRQRGQTSRSRPPSHASCTRSPRTSARRSRPRPCSLAAGPTRTTPTPRYVWVTMRRLRQKIEPDAEPARATWSRSAGSATACEADAGRDPRSASGSTAARAQRGDGPRSPRFGVALRALRPGRTRAPSAFRILLAAFVIAAAARGLWHRLRRGRKPDRAAAGRSRPRSTGIAAGDRRAARRCSRDDELGRLAEQPQPARRRPRAPQSAAGAGWSTPSARLAARGRRPPRGSRDRRCAGPPSA